MTFWITVAFGVGATVAVAVEIWCGLRQERLEQDTMLPASDQTEAGGGAFDGPSVRQP